MIRMKKVNYAAIDIVSNAGRLLIKCVNEENAPELMSKVQPVSYTHLKDLSRAGLTAFP